MLSGRVARVAVMAVAGVLVALGSPAKGQAGGGWAVLKTLPVGGAGMWDYLTVDSATHRLFAPRSTHTMVLDADSGKVLADIPGQKIAHGVAIVPEVNRGFISDGGGEGGVVVFDLTTYAVLGTLATMPDSDGIIWDPASGEVLVVSGDKGTLMSFRPDIDLKAGKMDAPVDLGGAPEYLASDGAGRVFINLMDRNEVAVVDLKTRRVVARWPVGPGGAPVGMSIDRSRHQIFIGCRKPQRLIVMSTEDGKVVSDLPLGEGVDATQFNKGLAFASTRDGALTVAAERPVGGFAVLETVKTPLGARTMGMDVATERIYLPTAEFEAPKPGSAGLGKMKPGTFMIVVVGRAGR